MKSSQVLARDLLAKLESLDVCEDQQSSSSSVDPVITGGHDDAGLEVLLSGSFAEQIRRLAERSKDILGKKLDTCVMYLYQIYLLFAHFALKANIKNVYQVSISQPAVHSTEHWNSPIQVS